MKCLLRSIVLLTIFYSLSPDAFALTSAERAEELFLEGKYDKVMIEADKAISADSGKRYELYYLKGLSAIKLNKFAEARKAFEYVTERYSSSDRVLDSYIGIGDAYYLEGNTSGALRSYRTAADKFADDKNIVVVRQRIADCLARPGMQERTKEYVAARPVEVKPVAIKIATVMPAAVKPAVKSRGSANFVPKKKAIVVIAPPAVVVPETVSRASAGQFSVQVGSFKSRSNATKLASKLSARRYEARVESPTESSDKLYRVKVGKISSKAEAEDLAVKLEREGYPTRVCQED